jgi:hypothetical protein
MVLGRVVRRSRPWRQRFGVTTSTADLHHLEGVA